MNKHTTKLYIHCYLYKDNKWAGLWPLYCCCFVTQKSSSVYVEQSKLSLIDLGSCTKEKTKNSTEVCLLDLGNVIMAKLNGHKHVPNK